MNSSDRPASVTPRPGPVSPHPCRPRSSPDPERMASGTASAATVWRACLGLGLALAGVPAAAQETVWLHDLDLSPVQQGWGRPQVNRSMREQPLQIAGQRFDHGVGTHARSAIWLRLAAGSARFLATVGLDDAANGPGSIQFRIVGDGRKLFESGVFKPGTPPQALDIDVRGIDLLLLQVNDGDDGVSYDHANWAEARFVLGDGPRPSIIERPRGDEIPVLLTPQPGPAPRVNGPLVYGCRPGNPFLYRIPTQGERPITFSARGLPDTLTLDPATGIVTGTAPPRGEYEVRFTARNPHGRATRRFTLVSGDTLSLTPSMGWNHWYTHYDRITDQLMREAADVMIRSGMADVGYEYVNIDDCWMNAPRHKDPLRVGPLRDDQGNLIPNRHFPDMRALTDYIHRQGLKAGLYTSPGPFTCAGFAGSWQHEAQDAKQFADWGFDFLKYDWCSYGQIAQDDPDPELVKFKKPYVLMGRLLREQSRDILFNLCQYGMGKVWEWGAEVEGHSWRTAGDLGFELDRIFEVALKNAEYRAWSRPGAWNDPDYIQIGEIGAAHGMGEPRPCPLSPNEQYAFMSLWCLSAAPLFFSGDMGRLDPFTLNVLCNPELIAVDQDPLGQCGRVVTLSEETFLMVKDLVDGTRAVGLFNRGEFPIEVTASWSDIGVRGRQPVRDLWRQQDLGRFQDAFAATVPRRGCVVVRIGRPSRN